MVVAPRLCLLFVSVLAFLVRRKYAQTSFGALHADEYYQSVEIGHSMKYGFGVISSEFQSRLALRSPLHSLFYVVVFSVSELLGVSYHQSGLLMMKSLTCLWTSLLPFAVGEFSLRFFGDISASICACIWAAFHPALSLMGMHSLVNSFVSPLLFFGLVFSFSSLKSDNQRLANLGGFTLALVNYMKPDSVAFVLLFYLASIPQNKRVDMHLSLAIGYLLGIGVAVGVDRWYYGFVVVTPLRWLNFNVGLGFSTIHGTEAPDYFRRVFLDTCPLPLVCALAGVLLLFLESASFFRNPEVTERTGEVRANLSRRWCLGVGVVAIFALYSSQSHKEPRFLHDWLVIFGVWCSLTLSSIFSAVTRTVFQLPLDRGMHEKLIYVLVPSVICLVILLASSDAILVHFPFLPDSEAVNQALVEVGDQNYWTCSGSRAHLKGLVMNIPWFVSGGWSLLHRKVPMVFLAAANSSFVFAPQNQAWIHGQEFGHIWMNPDKRPASELFSHKDYNVAILKDLSPSRRHAVPPAMLLSSFGFSCRQMNLPSTVHDRWTICRRCPLKEGDLKGDRLRDLQLAHSLAPSDDRDALLTAMGEALINQQKFKEAEKLFRDLAGTAKTPELQATALNNLGISVASQNRIHEAKFHFEHAVKLAPDMESARKNLEMAMA